MYWSFIIPAFNEEALLPGTLSSLAAAAEEVLPPGEWEVIVVDNNSTDQTATVASSAGARVVFESHNQIARARNAGAREAEGDFLIFLDADTELPPALLKRIRQTLESRRCCGGGAPVAFSEPAGIQAERMLSVWNALSGSLHVAAGSLLFCRREAFSAVGGFPEAVYAGEEIHLSRRLRRWGRREGSPFEVLREGPPVRTSPRKLDWHASWKVWGVHFLLALLPFLTLSRRCCGFWYKRP